MATPVAPETSYLQMLKNMFAPLTGAKHTVWYRFENGIYVADQTKNSIAGIKKDAEIVWTLTDAVEYITIHSRKVSFRPDISIDKKKISEISVLDGKTANPFQIKITGVDKSTQVWLVDTNKEIRVPGEIAYEAKRKN